MNFKFADKINPHLEKLDFTRALDIAESKLKETAHSEFHAVLGQSLVHQAEDVAEWVDRFFTACSARFPVKALYFEMIEFDINTDEWNIDGFAYDQDGGLDPDDVEWLVDYKGDTREDTDSTFIIEGFEPVQQAFANAFANPNPTREQDKAQDWCEQIVIARFMELMRSVHLKAKEKGLGWSNIPLYFTEHEYTFVVRSTIG